MLDAGAGLEGRPGVCRRRMDNATRYENKYKAVVKTLLTRYFMLTAFIVISTGQVITASTDFSNVFISCMQAHAVAFNQSVPFGYL